MPAPTDRSYTQARLVLVGAVALSVLAIAYWDVAVQLVHAWSTDDNYSHGFLIPPIAAFLAWERRHRFHAAPLQPHAAGLAMAGGSLLILALDVPVFAERLSLVCAVVGVVVLLFGWSRVRTLALPLGILLLMIPLPAPIFDRLELPLRTATSMLSEVLIRAADIPVLRSDNLLMLGNVTLEVARECSGIRTAISLVTLGLVFGYVPDSRSSLRVLVASLTIPVVILTNSARVAGTAIGTHYYGPAAATGVLHDLAGWFAFAAAFAIMLLLHRLLVLAVAERTLTPPPPANVHIQS